jgi:hypothetical protein
MQEGAESQAEDRTQVAVPEQKSHPLAGNTLKKSNFSKALKTVLFMRVVIESLGRRKRNNEMQS